MDNGTSKPKYKDENRNAGIIIGIVVFLLIFVFLIIVFIAIGISDPITQPNTIVDVETGTFLSSCTTTSCNNGLICDGTNFTCKLQAGAPCSLYSDCVTGLICSGLCATGNVGGLNELCPCNDGYQCVRQLNLLTICKGLGGVSCEIATDCVSGICDKGTQKIL